MPRMSRKFKADRRNTDGKGDSITILEAIASGHDTNTTGLPKVYSSKAETTRNMNIDMLMLVCTDCSRVWQRPISGGERNSFYYYEDFPTIGKKRKKCPECTKKK
mgnify:FL=1